MKRTPKSAAPKKDATNRPRKQVGPPRQPRFRTSQPIEAVPPVKTRRFLYDKNWSGRKKAMFWILTVLIVLFGYFGFRVYSGTSGIFSGSLFDILRRSEPLQTDSFGRSNILVFGTSEDSKAHGGAQLADSIMIVSVNQKTNQGNVISIPRDLWVEYGDACRTRAGKINATYSCALRSGKNETEASLAFTKVASEIIGTDVHYFVKVNQTVLKQLVDTLGGIEVEIESADRRGIRDAATGLNLPNGTAQLDGDQALALSKSRNSLGGYGLPRGNFDRELNQQKVVRAIQQKALSSGTLLNPLKVAGIAESLGTNVLSNIETRQLRTVLDIARNTPSDMLISIDLAERESPLVRSGSAGGQSIVQPSRGLFNYTDIQRAIRQEFTEEP